ncbi:MAG: TldD/PmbA family protein, partial [Chloroflexi bacterium]|nr:TldD/PmbA family protein [Chloroflexota bacterium]
MSDTTVASSLDLAEDVLAKALRAGASEAEVLVTSEDSALTRFANSEIHQNVAETNVNVSLRFIRGRRIAVAGTGRTDGDGILALIKRAAAIARTCEELEDWGGLPAPDKDAGGIVTGHESGYADTTAGATPEMRAEGVRAVIAAADDQGVLAYGSFSTSAEELVVANSAGIRARQRRTASQLLTVSMSAAGGTGYAEAAATDVSSIDAAAIGREAAAKARATENAVSLPAGDYPVVLEEYAVTDITDMLGYLGFSALA